MSDISSVNHSGSAAPVPNIDAPIAGLAQNIWGKFIIQMQIYGHILHGDADCLVQPPLKNYNYQPLPGQPEYIAFIQKAETGLILFNAASDRQLKEMVASCPIGTDLVPKIYELALVVQQIKLIKRLERLFPIVLHISKYNNWKIHASFLYHVDPANHLKPEL